MGERLWTDAEIRRAARYIRDAEHESSTEERAAAELRSMRRLAESRIAELEAQRSEWEPVEEDLPAVNGRIITAEELAISISVDDGTLLATAEWPDGYALCRRTNSEEATDG